MHQAEHSPQRQHLCLQKQAVFCTKAQSTLWKRLLLGSLYNSLCEVMRLRTSASLNFTAESYQWNLKSLHQVQRQHYFNTEKQDDSAPNRHRLGHGYCTYNYSPCLHTLQLLVKMSPLTHLSCATYVSTPVWCPFSSP